MRDICNNCGAWHGLHRTETNQCPRNGLEAAAGRQQLWDDAVFDGSDANHEIADLRAALIAANQEIEALHARITFLEGADVSDDLDFIARAVKGAVKGVEVVAEDDDDYGYADQKNFD